MTIRLKRKYSRYLLSLWTLLLLTLVGGTTACTEVDCPLDNVVEMGIGLYEAYLLLKQLEPLRPIIYLDAAGEWNSDPWPVER